MTSSLVWTTASPPRQHVTHRQLLEAVTQPPTMAEVDGILVPAVRGARQLRPAMRVAQRLGCPLVVLCSQNADPAEIEIEAKDLGVRVHAVASPDVDKTQRLQTRSMLTGGPFERTTDTSGKRNFGLALAWLAGWKHVLFLDDDIDIPDTDDLRRAAGLLAEFPVVGLDNKGFADNSVVCHANRDTGGRQGTFIGAGAMLFHGDRATSFFPHIYNEDWFFLLDDDRLTPCAVHGQFKQDVFNPYGDRDRAASQEFGDCLAEGLFALLDDNKSLADAGVEFWADFLASRETFISTAQSRLDEATGIHPVRRIQIANSLDAAYDSLELIEPEFCVEYMDAWRRDSRTWRKWIEGLPRDLSVADALSYLGAG